MAPVIGIDLGTTNTVVAAVVDGQVVTLPIAHGDKLLPSVVSFLDDGRVIVGAEAKRARSTNLESTIYSVKRLIGRSWSSREVQEARRRVPFKLVEGAGQSSMVEVRGESYTLPEISAFVLRKAKQAAEEYLGERVDRAVVTVPANFNDLQRAATKVAGRVAGLDVLRIINEPTAAALAYGFGKNSDSQRLAVYDLGGGTFDVTLLELTSNLFEVLATAGDTFLGGDDIDLAIALVMADRLEHEHRCAVRERPDLMERLRLSGELIKQQLSSHEDATVQVADLRLQPKGPPLPFAFSMTRDELERLVEPLLRRSLTVCERALQVARRSAGDFPKVLMVGGSTRMPLVRRLAQEFFEVVPHTQENPDEIVALGAAIQAAALAGSERRRSRIPPPPASARAEGDGRARMDTARGIQGPTSLPPAPTRPVVVPGLTAGREEPTPEHRTPKTTAAGLGDLRQGAPTTSPWSERRSAPPPPPARGSLPPSMPSTSRGLGPSAPPPPPPPILLDDPGHDPFGRYETPATDASFFGENQRDDKSDPSGQLPLALRLPSEREGAPAAPTGDDDGPTRRLRPQVRTAPAPVATSRRDTAPDIEVGSGLLAAALLASQPATGMAQREGTPSPSVGDLSAAVSDRASRPPLLLDVTPLSLGVETVGGYYDTIVPCNTRVPCSERRIFATAVDQQSAVRVRVAQGESRSFGENTLLGEVELLGLPPAPRGQAKVEVSFELDADGILGVTARDALTGRKAEVTLHLVGQPTESEGAMAQRVAGRLGGVTEPARAMPPVTAASATAASAAKTRA